MKIKLVFVIFFIISCQENKIAKNKTEANYQTQINNIKNFALEKNYNKDVAFMIDYSLYSGRNCFFVVDKNKQIHKKRTGLSW